VFYIVPIVNPDGVAEGNFRTDSQGKNLNRYYTSPSVEREPEIYYIKEFLVRMIGERRIEFCLDLHAHVNKQGAFIYGNYTSCLERQMRVCLFPKLLASNSEIFDFESCNFSEKNMSAKDKGD
jgi:predicted deacylase